MPTSINVVPFIFRQCRYTVGWALPTSLDGVPFIFRQCRYTVGWALPTSLDGVPFILRQRMGVGWSRILLFTGSGKPLSKPLSIPPCPPLKGGLERGFEFSPCSQTFHRNVSTTVRKVLIDVSTAINASPFSNRINHHATNT